MTYVGRSITIVIRTTLWRLHFPPSRGRGEALIATSATIWETFSSVPVVFRDMEDSPVVIRTMSRNSRKKRKRAGAPVPDVELIDVHDDSSTIKRPRSGLSETSAIRFEQDRALEESMAEDRRRSREKKRKRIEEERVAKRAKERRTSRLEHLAQRLLPEPPLNDPSSIAIKFLFKDLPHRVRRFPATATADAAFAFVESCDPRCFERQYEICGVHDAAIVLDPSDVEGVNLPLGEELHRISLRVRLLDE